MRRFVEVKDTAGKLFEPNMMMVDPISKGTRIFIPFPIEANPYLGLDKPEGRRYHANLMAQDEVVRRQWIYGDWHAGSSTFFEYFRPTGPISEEEKQQYPWARHVVDPVPFRDWWYRWGSGDWGYYHPSAFHKFIRNENDKRIHVYDEMQVRQVRQL